MDSGLPLLKRLPNELLLRQSRCERPEELLEPMEGSAGWSLKFEIRRKCLQARKLARCWYVGVRPRDLIHLLNTDLLLLPQMPVQFHGSFSEVAAWSSFRKPFHTFSSTKQWERRADSVFLQCVAESSRLWVGIWGFENTFVCYVDFPLIGLTPRLHVHGKASPQRCFWGLEGTHPSCCWSNHPWVPSMLTLFETYPQAFVCHCSQW